MEVLIVDDMEYHKKTGTQESYKASRFQGYPQYIEVPQNIDGNWRYEHSLLRFACKDNQLLSFTI